MNEPLQIDQQTDKRIVSNGEYVKANVLRSGMSLASVFLIGAVAVCGLGIVFLLVLLCSRAYVSEPEAPPIIQQVLCAGATLTLLGSDIYLFGKAAQIAQTKASAIDPGVPSLVPILLTFLPLTASFVPPKNLCRNSRLCY